MADEVAAEMTVGADRAERALNGGWSAFSDVRGLVSRRPEAG